MRVSQDGGVGECVVALEVAAEVVVVCGDDDGVCGGCRDGVGGAVEVSDAPCAADDQGDAGIGWDAEFGAYSLAGFGIGVDGCDGC